MVIMGDLETETGLTDLATIDARHRHITEKQARWYVKLLNDLAYSNSTVEDIRFPPTRWRANKLLEKRACCSVCSQIFRSVYQ